MPKARRITIEVAGEDAGAQKTLRETGQSADRLGEQFQDASQTTARGMGNVNDSAGNLGRRLQETSTRTRRLGDDFDGSNQRANRYGTRLDSVGERADTLDTRMMGLSDGIQGVTDLMHRGELAPHQMAMAFADLGSAGFNTVVPSLKSVGERVGGLRDRMRRSTTAVEATTTQLSSVGSQADATGGRLRRMGGRVRSVGGRMRGFAGRIGGVALGLGGLTAAIGLATAAWRKHEQEQAEAEARQRTLTDALEETNGQMRGQAVEAFTGELRDLTAGGGGVSELLNDMNSSLPEMARQFHAGGQEADAFRERLLSQARAAGASQVELFTLSENLQQLQTDTRVAGEDSQLLREAMRDGTGATSEAESRMREYSEAIAEANSELDQALSQAREWVDQQFGVANADIAVRDAMRDLNEHVAEHGLQLGRATEAGDRQHEMMQQLTDAHFGQVEALIQEGASTRDVNAVLDRSVGRLRDQAENLGLNREQTRQFTSALRDIPERRLTNVDVAFDDRRRQQIERTLVELARPRTVGLNVAIRSVGSFASNILSNPLFRQAGGDVEAGRAYVVGEKRPELFVPGEDGTILPSVPEGLTHDRGAVATLTQRVASQPPASERGHDRGGDTYNLDLRGSIIASDVELEKTVTRALDSAGRKGRPITVRGRRL